MRVGRFFAGLLFRLRHLPSVFRRFKFWFLLVLFLLVMALLAPWVGFLSSILRGIGRLLLPILESRVGRFVLVNALIVVAVVVLYRRFKARGRRLLGSFAMDRFLAGLLHLSAGRYGRAARCFEAVVRVGRWVKLEEVVPEYPEILPDARIKLSLCYRETGQLERAMKSLELLKVRDLSPARRRDLAEAKAFVYALSPALMPETIDREIDRALAGDGANPRLLRLKRDRATERGDLETAIEAQRKVLKGTPASLKGEERARLAILHARRALALRLGGRDDEALAEVARSRSCDPTLVVPSLVAGDIASERGDARGAVREWARAPSLPALERIRALLARGELTRGGDMTFLAGEFPRAGLLLLLAEHYLAEGKLRKARNALGKLEELGLFNRRTAMLMAEILRREGDPAGAERMEWKALKGFLGADTVPERL